MNTYIIHMTNRAGYEWVSEKGETEIVVAPDLPNALGQLLCVAESLTDQIYAELEENPINAVLTPADMLPLNFQVTEIPAVGKKVAASRIDEIIREKIGVLQAEILQELREETLKKQDAITELKAKAKELGISLKDIAKEL